MNEVKTNTRTPFETFQYWLFEPRNITDSVKRTRGRLIAQLSLALVLSLVFGLVFSANNALFLVLITFIGASYFLVRFGFINASAIVIVLILSVYIFPRVISQPDLDADGVTRLFSWIVVPVIFSSIAFSFRGALFVAFFEILQMLAMLIFIPHVTIESFTRAIGVPISAIALILLAMRNRDRIEQERQKNLLEVNMALRQSELTLENRVEERTAELQAAMVKVEEADRMKSNFLASMSHELRTPLNAILNFSEMTASGMLGDVNDRQQSVLMQVVESGKHLLSLINDILDISKIQSGKLNLLIDENVDVTMLIDSVSKSVTSLLGDKPVELFIEIEPSLPLIRADQRRLRQVLLNLLSNSVKFTEEGDITVSIKKAGANILFSVVDTGAGIPEENHVIIFEPFEQTEDGQLKGGTGLGLPISKQLVEAHGGEMWLQNNPERGTAFYFSIPILFGDEK